MMATPKQATTLGDLRKGLIDAGFDSAEAFEIVKTLIQRGDFALD
jgi:hypothetical protein